MTQSGHHDLMGPAQSGANCEKKKPKQDKNKKKLAPAPSPLSFDQGAKPVRSGGAPKKS